MTLTADLKLDILFAGLFMFSSFVFITILLHSIGSMSNLLTHMEEAFRMESDLRLNIYTSMLKQNKMRVTNQLEHDRRQEALLAIPLVRNQPNKNSKN